MSSTDNDQINVGGKLSLQATIELQHITANDVCVQALYGRLDGKEYIEEGETQVMKLQETLPDGKLVYQTEIPCSNTGQHGYTIRVLPCHPNLVNPHEMGLITWY